MRTSLQKLLEGDTCLLLSISFTEIITHKIRNENNGLIYVSVIGARTLSMSDYLVGLESSGWLRHIKSVVDAAVFLTKVLLFLFFFSTASFRVFIKCLRSHFPGCDGGRSQCVGSLFRRMGQNSSGLLFGGPAHGPLLPHHQGLHGSSTHITQPSQPNCLIKEKNSFFFPPSIAFRY